MIDDEDADFRVLLETLDAKARDDLRRVLILDQSDRDAISSRLMRYRDQNGQDCADIIDLLTMYPDARRRVVQVLGELEAAGTAGGDLLDRSRSSFPIRLPYVSTQGVQLIVTAHMPDTSSRPRRHWWPRTPMSTRGSSPA